MCRRSVRSGFVLGLVGILLGVGRWANAADTTVPDRLGREFEHQVRPLVKQYCSKCHDGETAEGEVDFRKFSSVAEIRRDLRAWQKVAEQLDLEEMPPKDARQPSAVQRKALRDWVGRMLAFEARGMAGDPGRVLVRRLNNVEYDNTIRDLTGLDLKLTREFPADGAAGEGFSNTGDALVMSPALLTKYLDAAKEVASHAVLLPAGFRFAPSTSRRDWTDDLVREIREIYTQYADKDGKLPLEAYLAATLELRDAKAKMTDKDVAELASRRGLSPRYLAALWSLFDGGAAGTGGGFLLDALRSRWRTIQAADIGALAGEIRAWQAALWKFNPVGYAFTTPWQEPVSPVVTSRTIRYPIRPAEDAREVVIRLASWGVDEGQGRGRGPVVWKSPRLEAPGLPPIALRDLRAVSDDLIARRGRLLAVTARYLAAAAEFPGGGDPARTTELANRHGLEAEGLSAWLQYLGLSGEAPIPLDSYFKTKIMRSGMYDFVQGWGAGGTPNLVANASGGTAQVPGTMAPHSVAVHPSPALAVVVGWRSPVDGRVRINARVRDAHAGCGNGVSWALEHRRAAGRRRLAGGAFDDGKGASHEGAEPLAIRRGDLITLIVGPRDGNHGCDLTRIDLEIAQVDQGDQAWRLAPEVSGSILAGNPHADAVGRPDVWHFFTEPASGTDGLIPVVPPGSLLARWLDEPAGPAKVRLADEIQRLVTAPAPAPKSGTLAADRQLYREIRSLGGPLLRGLASGTSGPAPAADRSAGFGPDPARFGKRPDGTPIEPDSLAVATGDVLEIRMPADLVAGRELVVAGELPRGTVGPDAVQIQASESPPLVPSRPVPGLPILVRDDPEARSRLEAALAGFRGLFPGALCFRQIVPIDEVVTVIQFYRGDESLSRLMLDDAGRGRLDRLWDELHHVSQDRAKMYEIFDQMLGFASQEGETAKVEAWRTPITRLYEDGQKALAEAEPRQLEALGRFCAKIYRRPATARELEDLRALYKRLRAEGQGHEDAIRLTLARCLVSPEFLYRAERPAAGHGSRPVSDWELAGRLSYFLWSSMPDDALFAAAESGKLHEPEVLKAQLRRMLGDGRIRALAVEFACQWLEIKGIESLEEKSERHFPDFAAIRGELSEEAVRFFIDLFRRDGSVLELIDADHTFLNESLAKFYGIPGVKGTDWRRVDGVRAYGRGGVLGLGATLARQSGASRTSPILRGNWLVETVLGEKLPKPPKGVPLLPEDEAATKGLTVRQLVEKHRASSQCAGCHNRIDPFGFALEGYDPIGRRRDRDLGDRPIDARATLPDGTAVDGLDGLRRYLLARQRGRIVRNFCKKLTGFALGRAVQLSDQPQIDEMARRLEAGEYRVSIVLESIVLGRPFREHRALDEVAER